MPPTLSPDELANHARTSALRRSILLRDATTFLALGAVTVVLFGVTLWLFRSFEARRQELGRSWAAKGRDALDRQNPQAAVPALRAALSYTPDERSEQLLLAEALAGSGHQEEATNYFLNLWTARPGDGFVNLQLARLARKRDDPAQAVEYYRAAVFGDWGDQGPVRRRRCRLELASYLSEIHDLPAARTELLLAAGNAAGSAPVLLPIGERLAAAGDLSAALNTFERALEAEPGNVDALLRAEAAALAAGSFTKTEDLYAKADHGAHRGTSRQITAAAALARDASRLSELSLSRELPAGTRARHLVQAAGIAQARLLACTPAPPPPPAADKPVGKERKGESAKPAATGPAASIAPAPPPSSLEKLNATWKTSGRELRRRALAGNADAQDNLADLIFGTEIALAAPAAPSPCGSPAGDDLLLLLVARAQGHSSLTPIPAITAFDEHLQGIITGRSLPPQATMEAQP